MDPNLLIFLWCENYEIDGIRFGVDPATATAKNNKEFDGLAA